MENILELRVHFLETMTIKIVMRSTTKFFVYSIILKTINSRDPLNSKWSKD